MRGTYGHINGEPDMHRVFRDIRRDVRQSRTRSLLTELYRRAGYFIVLTYAPSWSEKFGRRAARLRSLAREEFRSTARLINRQAELIGSAGDYHETWGRHTHVRGAGGNRQGAPSLGRAAGRGLRSGRTGHSRGI